MYPTSAKIFLFVVLFEGNHLLGLLLDYSLNFLYELKWSSYFYWSVLWHLDSISIWCKVGIIRKIGSRIWTESVHQKASKKEMFMTSGLNMLPAEYCRKGSDWVWVPFDQWRNHTHSKQQPQHYSRIIVLHHFQLGDNYYCHGFGSLQKMCLCVKILKEKQVGSWRNATACTQLDEGSLKNVSITLPLSVCV